MNLPTEELNYDLINLDDDISVKINSKDDKAFFGRVSKVAKKVFVKFETWYAKGISIDKLSTKTPEKINQMVDLLEADLENKVNADTLVIKQLSKIEDIESAITSLKKAIKADNSLLDDYKKSGKTDKLNNYQAQLDSHQTLLNLELEKLEEAEAELVDLKENAKKKYENEDLTSKRVIKETANTYADIASLNKTITADDNLPKKEIEVPELEKNDTFFPIKPGDTIISPEEIDKILAKQDEIETPIVEESKEETKENVVVEEPIEETTEEEEEKINEETDNEKNIEKEDKEELEEKKKVTAFKEVSSLKDPNCKQAASEVVAAISKMLTKTDLYYADIMKEMQYAFEHEIANKENYAFDLKKKLEDLSKELNGINLNLEENVKAKTELEQETKEQGAKIAKLEEQLKNKEEKNAELMDANNEKELKIFDQSRTMKEMQEDFSTERSLKERAESKCKAAEDEAKLWETKYSTVELREKERAEKFEATVKAYQAMKNAKLVKEKEAEILKKQNSDLNDNVTELKNIVERKNTLLEEMNAEKETEKVNTATTIAMLESNLSDVKSERAQLKIEVEQMREALLKMQDYKQKFETIRGALGAEETEEQYTRSM